MAGYRRILVPVDGSETSNKALVAALNLARDMGSTVRLLHSIDELAMVSGLEDSGYVMQVARDYGAKTLEDGLAVARAAGVDADTHLIELPGQRVGEAVAAEAKAWEADLIVVGTHGRKGIGRVLLGSGAEQVIRNAPVPVLVIRGGPGVD
ncbi:MAG TPA: universal stress protein [Ramlibacter sp.]|uniref:universal stress protein n=1 Tax=Ramlibacter sp. TaxID=1917967 RepID=UPI002BC9FD09|nr:universal stress protein [Ramlibacter sp.]HVZ42836.1 universal stress protein [Ramlibacter sp.]